MPARTPLYVVCSPLDRVGKTLLARLLAEFLIGEGRRIEAFDLNDDSPALIDYLPRCTTPATLADTRGQMALFDRLVMSDGIAKLVDIGGTAFAPFFTIVARIGFVPEAARQNIQVVVLFVSGRNLLSAKAYAGLQPRLPGSVLVPVHNEALGGAVLHHCFPPVPGAALPLRLPLLAPALQRTIADPGFSFAMLREDNRTTVRMRYACELRSWLKRIQLEFRELELNLLLRSLCLAAVK
jgi:hypothetical protein